MVALIPFRAGVTAVSCVTAELLACGVSAASAGLVVEEASIDDCSAGEEPPQSGVDMLVTLPHAHGVCRSTLSQAIEQYGTLHNA